jgi:hypothetical protein
MAGLVMNMGLGGGASYSGPVFGSDGGAAVPATVGYPDTAPGRAMTFGPGGVSGGSTPTVHALAFGVVCFAALVFIGWVLPR